MFGCIASLHLDKSKKNKLNKSSICSIHLGLDTESKAYQIYIPSQRKILITQDVVFDKNSFFNTSPINTTFTIDTLFLLALILPHHNNYTKIKKIKKTTYYRNQHVAFSAKFFKTQGMHGFLLPKLVVLLYLNLNNIPSTILPIPN